MKITITIERDRASSADAQKYRAKLRQGPIAFASARHFGSASRAKLDVENFFGRELQWTEGTDSDVLWTAEVEM